MLNLNETTYTWQNNIDKVKLTNNSNMVSAYTRPIQTTEKSK